jgi:hypothetical protein
LVNGLFTWTKILKGLGWSHSRPGDNAVVDTSTIQQLNAAAAPSVNTIRQIVRGQTDAASPTLAAQARIPSILNYLLRNSRPDLKHFVMTSTTILSKMISFIGSQT